MFGHLVISNWHGCYSASLPVCVGACVGCHSPPPVVFQCRLQKLRVSPVASQCGADSTKFLQWHSSVGLFQLSFSRGVPVYPAIIRWVAQWYPSVHWVNQWHSSVHWTSQCTLAQGRGLSTLATGVLVHQYPQSWLNGHYTGPVWYRNTSVIGNNIRKWNYIMVKNKRLKHCAEVRKNALEAVGRCNGMKKATVPWTARNESSV